MTYEDYVWFFLSEIDKTSVSAMRYWFRCLDMDGGTLPKPACVAWCEAIGVLFLWWQHAFVYRACRHAILSPKVDAFAAIAPAENDHTVAHPSLPFPFIFLGFAPSLSDGALSMYEIEYFYEEQLHRQESLMLEIVPYEDMLCTLYEPSAEFFFFFFFFFLGGVS